MELVCPKINDYTAVEIQKACSSSPAIERYLKVIKKENAPDFYLKRHSAWLRAALATFHNKHSSKDICNYWSNATLELLNLTWKKLFPENNTISMYALGKLGAKELNLSSDIDVVFFSESQPNQEDIKSVKQFIKMLSQNSEFGFGYRVDLNLRPGGSFGPIITSIKQLEDYLWSQAANWERVAYVRLLKVFGPPDNHIKINELIRSFVYRKYLDFNLIEDIRELRSQIHGLNQKKLIGDFNLKLDEGGIRDIELYINSLQVIHGGKNKDLQTQSTHIAFNLLLKDNLISNQETNLIEHYWNLRTLENFAQILNDQQTHILNKKYFNHFSVNFETFKTDCNKAFKKVSSLLGDTPLGNIEKSTITLISKDELLKLGFSHKTIEETWSELTKTLLATPHKNKNTKFIISFLNQLIQKIAQTPYDKDLGVNLALTFVKNNRVKISIFTLLLREQPLFDDIVTLLSSSPYLGGILSQRPELLDSFIYKKQEYTKNDFEFLLEELTDTKLINEMSSSANLLKTHNIVKFVKSLSHTTDEIIRTLFTEIKILVGAEDLDILALGKWGGNENGLRSDLDLVFVKIKGSITKNDHRAAKRLISRLMDQHKGGQLYSVDLRLKPSGVSGPLLLTYEQLIEYLSSKAAIWERMPYVKSRMLFNKSISNEIHKSCKTKEVVIDDFKTMEKIKQQLINKNYSNGINLKYNSGGLLAVEFLTQMHSLKEANKMLPTNTFELLEHFKNKSKEPLKWQRVLKNYTFLRLTEQLFALSTFSSSHTLFRESGNFLRVAALLGQNSKSLADYIKEKQLQTSQLVKDLTP